MINKLKIDAKITTHLDGKHGFEYLTENFNAAEKYIIFLDINMPIMNGWGFLNELNKVDFSIDHIKVYIVSSSTDDKDIKKATSYVSVKRFLSKPLLMETLKEIFSVIL